MRLMNGKRFLAGCIKAKPLRRPCSFYRGQEKVEHLGVSFWCRYQAGDVKIDPGEHSEYRWATPEEALSLITDENGRRAIRCFIQSYKY